MNKPQISLLSARYSKLKIKSIECHKKLFSTYNLLYEGDIFLPKRQDKPLAGYLLNRHLISQSENYYCREVLTHQLHNSISIDWVISDSHLAQKCIQYDKIDLSTIVRLFKQGLNVFTYSQTNIILIQ